MRAHLRERGLGILVAIAATAATAVVRAALSDVQSTRAPFLPFVVPVMLAGWYGGWWPGVVATALSALTSLYCFIPPEYSLRVESLQDAVGVTLFAFCGVVVSALCEGMHVARRRLEQRVSDHRRAEAALLESQLAERARRAEVESYQEQLRIVTEAMSIPVSRCSRDLRYLWVSRQFCDWFGLTQDGVIGRPIVDIIGPEALERLRPYFARALSGERVQFETEVNYRGRGRRWVNAIYSPTYGTTDVPDGWVAVIMDITDRKKGEEALIHADRRKDEFLATLAHELRNPLAPILNAAQVLKTLDPASPQLAWSRDVIDRQVKHMSRLLDDLLDISRITRNRLELRKEHVALSTVVSNAIETSSPLLEANRHELQVAIPAQPVILHVDSVRLAQVLSNLLNNAARYTDPGGHIRLAAEQRDSEVSVSVEDDGTGIAPEVLPRIFENFTRKVSGSQDSRGGLGIGLSLAKGLVEMHGGTIEAASEGVGKGSRFTVRLPTAAKAGEAQARPEDAPARARRDRGRRLLVVDDNRDSADSLAMVLRKTGHEVGIAYGGADAITAADASHPDAILLDLGMPGMDGYQVARKLREREWAKGVTLIAVTGWGQDEDKRRSKEAGFDHHLVKPVDHAELARLLAELEVGAR